MVTLPDGTTIPLVGTWSLISMTYPNPDGHEVAPWGLQPLGRITYTVEGVFSAVIGSPLRELTSPSARAPVEAQAASFRNSLGYAGTYELVGGTMLHRVDVATDPTWEGSVQERYVAYDGRILSLSTPPVVSRRDPAGHSVTLTWEKLT